MADTFFFLLKNNTHAYQLSDQIPFSYFFRRSSVHTTDRNNGQKCKIPDAGWQPCLVECEKSLKQHAATARVLPIIAIEYSCPCPLVLCVMKLCPCRVGIANFEILDETSLPVGFTKEAYKRLGIQIRNQRAGRSVIDEHVERSGNL